MEKLAFFFIDDVIMTMRDIARQRPASLFDNPFMAMLKKGHDLYGMTVQLNLFYRTDFFYGGEEFTLAQFPDCYKPEFEASSDWLRLAFHAKQEFPDYPYVNGRYEDVKRDFEQLRDEVFRFAGEKSWSHTVIPHWLPISREGCQALYDCGIRFLAPSWGERTAYNGDPESLPYGHWARLLQNRQPETMVYERKSKNTAILRSICAYNHVTDEEYDSVRLKNASIPDEGTGMRFRQLSGGPCLNLYTYDEVQPAFDAILGAEYIGTANHEEYFYSDYYAYQPDYVDKVLLAAKIMHEKGYRYITAEEFK